MPTPSPHEPSDGSEILRVQREFAASPFRLSRAWTDPKQLAQWWGPASFALGAGGAIFEADGYFQFRPRMGGGELLAGRLRWLELSPPHSLRYALHFVGNDPHASREPCRHPHDPLWPLELHQTVRFEPVGEKTCLILEVQPSPSATPAERANFLDAHPMVLVATEVLLDQLLDYLAEATQI